MNKVIQLDPKEAFHRATGFIGQAYYFFASCLPHQDDEFPCVIKGIHFCDSDHVRVYENELSYSFLLRYFGALEELCNRLKIEENRIPEIIEKSSASLYAEYKHIRNLRHVIAHGNGDGEVIKNKYANFKQDRNGDLSILITDVDGFTEVINSVADIFLHYDSSVI